MTSLQLRLQARAAQDVPWDKARERRVLGRALESRQRHARRTMAFELAAVVAITFAAGRTLPYAPAESSDETPAVAAPAAPTVKSAPMGGVAGTGGHGGTGSNGHGGNAGTG